MSASTRTQEREEEGTGVQKEGGEDSLPAATGNMKYIQYIQEIGDGRGGGACKKDLIWTHWDRELVLTNRRQRLHCNKNSKLNAGILIRLVQMIYLSIMIKSN